MNELLAIAMGKQAGGGVKPKGEIDISANGEYDVTEYATARVRVGNPKPIISIIPQLPIPVNVVVPKSSVKSVVPDIEFECVPPSYQNISIQKPTSVVNSLTISINI